MIRNSSQAAVAAVAVADLVEPLGHAGEQAGYLVLQAALDVAEVGVGGVDLVVPVFLFIPQPGVFGLGSLQGCAQYVFLPV